MTPPEWVVVIFSVEEMIMDLREVDFNVEEFRGMSWNPLFNQWSWIDSLDCNYLVHAKRLQ